MWNDEAQELEREAARLEAKVSVHHAGLVVKRLEAEAFEQREREVARKRRDELADRVRLARAEVAAWRERTARRAQALQDGEERQQGWFTSMARGSFRLALIVVSACAVVTDGSVSALALALLPVVALWCAFLGEQP
jgi:uncharacterized membrane protein YdbT with pleckstrin-like domain